jgi:hypothetical protein
VLSERLRLRAQSSAVFAVGVVAVAAVGVAVSRYPEGIRGLNNRAAHNAQQSPLDRDLELADRVGIERAFVLAARRYVPERGRYTVATGSRAPQPTPLTLQAVPGYLQNLLLPRFQTDRDPRFLLCYGCDPSPWQARVRVLWRRGPLGIARVEK